MLRVLTLCAGLAGAGAASQYPAFSDAYLQRLAGQVDALTQVVEDFDASALAAGLGREAALREMTGTPFLTARQADMRATFARHARLADHLSVLRGATPLERVAMPHRMMDADTLAATWADFQPGLPLSVAGAVTAGGGFVVGWLGAAALFGALGGLVRSRPRRRVAARPRSEPVVNRPQPRLVTEDGRPRLGGAQR